MKINSSLLLYAFIGVCVLRIGLSFYGRHLMADIVETSEKFALIEKEVEMLRHFDDSIAQSEKFRRKILDTVRTNQRNRLMLIKQGLRQDLTQKIIAFDKQHPNRESKLTWFKIIDGVKILSNILLVIFGLPIFIHLIRTR